MNDPERPTDFTGLWVVRHGRHARTETEFVEGVANGLYRSWLENGVCHREAFVKDGQWHGTMIVRRSDGIVLDVSEFEDGTGIYRIFNTNGELTDEVPLLRGKRHGAVRFWRLGKLVATQFYDNGECKAAICED